MGFKLRPGTSLFGNVTFDPELGNRSPVLSGIDSSYVLTQDQDLIISGLATDPDGDDITWSHSLTSGDLSGASVSQSGNVFTITPGGQSTTFEIQFTATDSEGSSTSTTSSFEYVYIPPSWVVVGAPEDREAGQANNYTYPTGAVYVYNANDLSASPTKLMLDGPLWNQQQIGEDVAVSADKIIVGAKEENNSWRDGSVYVYDANDLTAQPTKLTAFDGAYNDHFGSSSTFRPGHSIAATSDKIIVGAPLDDDKGSNSGSFYVFDANNLSATPTKLTTFDGSEGDELGSSIVATADKIFIGVAGDDDRGTQSGSVYVYDANDLTAQPTKLTAFDGIAFDSFGTSIVATSDKLIVGAPYSNGGSGNNSGSAYVFDVNNLSATPTKLTSFDGAANDYFGYSVTATSDKIVVGATRNNEMGAVYVFDANNLSATPTKLTAFDGASWDDFGGSVAVVGNKIIVGAPYDDGSVSGSNNNGSVYVFDGNDLSAQPIKLTETTGKFGISVAATPI